MSHHIAEINVARALAPLDDPLLAEFVARLDEVNRVADESPGFIWRLKDETGGPSSYVQAFDDPHMLINMSVWESIEALRAYVYRTHEHLAVFRERRRWFESPSGPQLALWWVPVGHVPALVEGKARLDLLAERGPTRDAFTFKQAFTAAGGAAGLSVPPTPPARPTP